MIASLEMIIFRVGISTYEGSIRDARDSNS